MPKVVYTAAKGLVQETGSGFEVSDVGLTAAAAAGVTCNGFLAGFIPDAASTTSASGAISVATYFTNITIDGTKAYTIAAGTAVGQLKKIMCSAAINTPAGTLTIANPVSASTDVVLFSAAGDTLDLVWTGAAWRILGAYNVASGNVASPVVS
jgi:hypothetical protein